MEKQLQEKKDSDPIMAGILEEVGVAILEYLRIPFNGDIQKRAVSWFFPPI